MNNTMKKKEEKKSTIWATFLATEQNNKVGYSAETATTNIQYNLKMNKQSHVKMFGPF